MGDATRRLGLVNGGVLPMVRDQLGRELSPGASVILPGMDTKMLLWQVENVRPNLHPQAPPNTVIVQVVMRAQLVVPKGAAVREIILVAEPMIPEAAATVPADAPSAPDEPEAPMSSDDLSAQRALDDPPTGDDDTLKKAPRVD